MMAAIAQVSGALEDVVEDVFELLLFADASPMEEQQEGSPSGDPVLVASIELHSPIVGRMTVCVAEEVVGDWCEQVQFASDNDPRRELLAELVNTLAGCLQGSVAQATDAVSVGTPTLCREEKWCSDADDITAMFDVEDKCVAVAISLSTGSGT